MTRHNILYWAEEELGAPFPHQDDTWVASRYLIGRALGALACAATVATLGVLYARVTSERAQYVQIAAYEGDAPADGAASVRSLAPTVGRPAARSARQASSKIPVEAKSKARGTALPKSEGTTKIAIAAAPAPASPPTNGQATAAAEPSATAKTPKLTMFALSPRPSPSNAPSSNVASKSASTAPSTTGAAGGAESDIKGTPARIAEKKPTDIASGAALGIREVLADGIVMMNGRKIKNGAALPNGELLLATDAPKGIAETDRRVMVVTP